MNITTFKNIDSLKNNTYLIEYRNCNILIDASISLSEILEYKSDIVINAIFLTHTHFDHFLKINEIYEKFKCPVFILKGYKDYLYNIDKNLSKYAGLKIKASKKIKITEIDSENININGLNVEVIKTPGHSPCSVCYKIGNYLFSGDTIFAKGIGRYDLPESNKLHLLSSINLLDKIDFEIGYPGHGENFSKDEMNLIINLYTKYLSRKK